MIWHRVLDQALIGEGAIYLTEPYVSILDKDKFLNIASRHDVFPLLFTRLVGGYFRDQMWLYYLSMLIIVSVVNYTLYLLVAKVTGKWLGGAIAVSFLIANFVGSFQKLGQGYYQWFIQRIPQFAPALVGLILLINFYSTRRKIYYYLSVFFYLLAFFLGHYTLIILPLFVIYPLVYVFINRGKTIKQYAVAFIQTIPFILGSYLFLRNQDLNAVQISFGNQITSKVGVLYYLTNAHWLDDLVREITLVTVPIVILKSIVKYVNTFFTLSEMNYSELEIVQGTSYVVVFVLLLLFLFVYRKLDIKIRPFFATATLGFPLVTFIVMYINPGAISTSLDTSRYLYTPSLVIAMFWGVCLFWFAQRNKITKVLIIILMVTWIVYNGKIIDDRFNRWQPTHNTVLATIEYVRNNHSQIPEKSVIVSDALVSGYSAGMLDHFYGGENLKVLYYDSSLPKRLEKSKQSYNNVVFLRYKNGKIEPITKDINEVIEGKVDLIQIF